MVNGTKKTNYVSDYVSCWYSIMLWGGMFMLKKKLLSYILIISILCSTVTPVFAYDGAGLSKTALMVSEEFAEVYPNGVIELATVKFDTQEGAEDFDVVVVRRGGTTGQVKVDFKVIEVSAKYEDDFSILMPKWHGDSTLKKEKDSPTLLEASLEENKDGFITSPKYMAKKIEQESVGEEVYAKKSMIGLGYETDSVEETVSEDVYTVNLMNDLDNERDLPTGNVIEESYEEIPKIKQTVQKETSTTEYKSSLHQMRDKAVGKTSEAPQLVKTQMNIFDIEDPEQIKVGDALNTLMPGATASLTFEDGENYKTFKVRIKDDDVFEGPEQFTIGLFEPTGGAVLGDAFNAVCNISDNDKGVGQSIGFERKSYSVSAAEKKATLNIVRSGDINTYAKIEISTLSGTAKADEHYAPVMTDTMFLPGETNKKVLIPLLVDSVSEKMSFKMVITADGKPTSGINRTTVNIMPDTADKEFSVMSNSKSVSLSSAPETWVDSNDFLNYRDRILIRGNQFHYDGSGIPTIWGTMIERNCLKFCGPYGQHMPLREGLDRYASMSKWGVDLRGINKITWHWANNGHDHEINNRSQLVMPGEDDAVSYIRGGKFECIDDEVGETEKFSRQKNALLQFANRTMWNMDGDLYLYEVNLYKQQFYIDVRQADNLSYETYNGETRVDSTSFMPGSVELSNSEPYRDETITLTPNITEEGNKRGVRLVGYRIFNTKSGSYGNTVYSTEITFTPDFIENYIYNGGGGSSWHESLIIKPVFERENAGELKVLDYNDTQGELKIGGTKYINTSFPMAGRKIGDLVMADLMSDAGYTAQGMKAIMKNANSFTQKDLGISDNIELSQETKVEPIFQRNDNTVLIKWKAPATGSNETEVVNRARGLILHDRPGNMLQDEYNVLFNGVDNTQTAEVREEKIRENYTTYRQQFSTYTIQEAAIGDIITLYAKPNPGYTVRWWTNVAEETGEVISESDVTKSLPHIGSSFSFQVTNTIQNVYYYFTPINNAGNKVFEGKVIRSLNTIKRQSTFAIDINNPNTYVGVPGVSVAIAVADSSNLSIAVDGKRYGTTAVTNKNGDFKLYVPYGVPDALYSVKLLNGEKIMVKSILVNNKMFLEIPFMDELKVRDMQVSGINSDSTTLEITDRQATLSIIATSDNNRRISKVRFRSYDGLGAIWQTLDAAYDGFKWNLDTNLRESFKNNGRITVELYDETGAGHGEIETGYTLYEPPSESNVAMPDIPSIGDGADVDVIGIVNPETSLGTSRNKTPKPVSEGSETYTIAVGSGEVLKQVVADNASDFDNKNTAEKMAILASYLNNKSYSTNLKNKTWEPEKEADKADGASKTGKGKGSLKINFDVGFYIQLTRETEGNRSDYYFDYAMIYVAFGIDARQDFNTNICGIPVYITLRGGGRIRGLLMAEGGDNTKITAYGWFPADGDLSGTGFYGLFHVNAYVAIGAGVGMRGQLSIGVEGQMDLDIVYQPWDNGAGTLTFGLNVDIDILFIPLKFNVTKYTLPLFRTPGYVDNNWLPEVSAQSAYLMANKIAREDGVSSAPVLARAENMSGWMPQKIKALFNVGAGLYEPVPPVTLQDDIYKHPQPELISLEDGKKLLFFVNDDLVREDYDRTAVYYSVYNGTTWEEPVMIQDDGTADNDPSAKLVGDKILVCWSSADRTFGSTEPTIAQLLNSTDIYAQFFNMQGEPIGAPEQLTNDEKYANSMPQVAYDEETGGIMVVYHTTDYETEDVEFDGDVLSIGDFLHNSYSTIAYRMYVDDAWQNSYYDDETNYLDYEAENGEGSLGGQRFIDFAVADLDAPKVTEITAVTHEGKALIIYTLDVDQDPNTKDDTEIFMKVYDFVDRAFTEPIRITDNLTPDSNPQVVEYEENAYLYWNNNNYISYLDFDATMEFGLLEKNIDGITYYEIKEDYNNYQNVINEENADAAESFTVTMGEDGNIYVVWSELIQKVIEFHDGDVVAKQRHLFSTMYDAKFSEVYSDENGEPVYRGGWGSKWQLTRQPWEYNNEQAIAVDDDGTVTIVNRLYEIVENLSTEDINDTKESDTSSLVARLFIPMSTLTINDSDIETYPQYPRPGERVILTINAKNDGFMPSKQATFKLDLIDDEGNLVPICDDIVINSHIASGSEISASTSFTMPENISDVRVNIKAWERDLEDTATEKTYTVLADENLVIENQMGYFISQNKMRLTGTLLNIGNLDADNVRLTIESFDDEAMTKALMSDDVNLPESVIHKTMEFPHVGIADKFEIDEIIDVPDELFGEKDDVEFSINLKQMVKNDDWELVEATVHTKRVVLHKEAAANTNISDIWVNNNQNISLLKGTTQSLEIQILPQGAANTYKLQYKSLNPEIAEVDASSGAVTAKAAGTAQIVIEAVKYNNIYFQNADNRIYTPNGSLAEFNPDGTPLNRIEESGESEAALIKTVEINVTSPNTSSSKKSKKTQKPRIVEGNDEIAAQIKTTSIVKNSVVTAAISELEKSKQSSKVLELMSENDTTSIEKTAIETLSKADAKVKISLKEGEMTLSKEVLESIVSKADSSVTASIKKSENTDGRPVVDIEIISGSEKITDFGGEDIIIKIPYTLKDDEDENAIVVYYVDADGEYHMITNGQYQDGFVTFMINHLSKFAIGYHQVEFADVTGWEKEYVTYLAARGIINGIGDSKFAPKNYVTRAEFVKMLAVLSGEMITEDAETSFSDVDKNEWYAPYVAWAAKNGYVLGTSEKTFAPKDKITREQMAVIIDRFAKTNDYHLNNTEEPKAFTDAADISGYAKEAVMIMKKSEIISGKSNNVFAPKENATRAESSKMLAKLLSIILE